MVDKKLPETNDDRHPAGWVPNPSNPPPDNPPPTHPTNPPDNPPTSPSSPPSSSSGGGSSAPPADPRIAQLESLFRSAYIQLWGEPPTEAYVKHAAHSGMNVTEFVQRERHKEAWKNTKAYEDEFDQILGWMRQSGAA